VKVRGWNGHPVKTLYPDWVDVELLQFVFIWLWMSGQFT
jgi:hypothetical protein